MATRSLHTSQALLAAMLMSKLTKDPTLMAKQARLIERLQECLAAESRRPGESDARPLD